jgi:hypothetical protein
MSNTDTVHASLVWQPHRPRRPDRARERSRLLGITSRRSRQLTTSQSSTPSPPPTICRIAPAAVPACRLVGVPLCQSRPSSPSDLPGVTARRMPRTLLTSRFDWPCGLDMPPRLASSMPGVRRRNGRCSIDGLSCGKWDIRTPGERFHRKRSRSASLSGTRRIVFVHRRRVPVRIDGGDYPTLQE